MQGFRTWSYEDREQMFANKKNVVLKVLSEDLHFQNIEKELECTGISVKDFFELPPLITDKKTLTQIIEITDKEGFYGRWTRTFIRIYWENGKVYFKKINEKEFEVSVVF